MERSWLGGGDLLEQIFYKTAWRNPVALRQRGVILTGFCLMAIVNLDPTIAEVVVADPS